MNSYFQSLNNARLNQLKDLRVSISQSERVEKRTARILSLIETDTKQLVQEQASLQKKREEKKEIVRKFKLEIKKTQRKIEEIEENKETLVAFLSELRNRDQRTEHGLSVDDILKNERKARIAR